MTKKEISLKFETDLPNEEYKLQSNVLTLPLISTPEKLNQLLNKLLSLSPPQKFIFLINNTKLTTSLEEFFSTNNLITTEQTLDIYYLLEMNQPNKFNTIKEDEWIKKIEIFQKMKYNPQKHNDYVVGLFNGEISFYSGNDNSKKYSLKSSEPLDENTISMLTDVKYFSLNNENHFIIRTMKNSINTYDIYNIDTKSQTNTLLYNESKKENEYFNCIALNPTNFNIFSMGGSENDRGVVKIFKIPENLDVNEGRGGKRRKIASKGLEAELVFDNLHNMSCGNTIFLDNDYIVTGGDNFELNIYNIVNKNLFMTYHTNYKNVSSMCRVDNKSFLVGYIDGTIKYYNLSENKAINIFRDNTSEYGFVSDINMSNDKDNHPLTFATSSYDNYIKVWDIRGGKVPLYKIGTDETEKNFSVKFNGNDELLAGGDGSSVNIYKY